MANWQLKQAGKRPGYCAACEVRIEPGEWRFGATSPSTKWFHLRCAPRAAPQVWARFKKQGEKLLTAEVAQPILSARSKRLAQVEAAASVEVLGDALEEDGDPWGRLIALRRAGKHDEAREHLWAHRVSLCGSLNPECLEWRDGVVVGANLSGPSVHKQLDEFARLRTTVRVERLQLGGAVGRPALEALSKLRAPALRELVIATPTRSLAALHLPQVVRLSVPLDESVFDARLPGLKVLQLSPPGTDVEAPLHFFERLLSAPLLTQLERFDLEDSGSSRGMTGDGLRLLLANASKLAHLNQLSFRYEDRLLRQDHKALARKLFAARVNSAKKEDRAREKAANPLDD